MTALAMYTSQFIPSKPGGRPGAGFATTLRRIGRVLAPSGDRGVAP